jgi:hypothetical protein
MVLIGGLKEEIGGVKVTMEKGFEKMEKLIRNNGRRH